MLTEEKIQIKDLLLWDENSRLTDDLFGKNQQEIIDTFLGNEKKFFNQKSCLGNLLAMPI